jgi:cyclic-di-GMP-binding protein
MPSFDVVSKVQWHEVDNALQQAQKEIAQRFDFKDTDTEVEKKESEITVKSLTEDRARAGLVVLQGGLIKRKVSMKALDIAKPVPTSKGGSRIVIKVQEGIEGEKAKAVVAAIKEAKLKVQAAIQAEQVRVTGKNRDDLQGAIALLKGKDFGIDLQFINFRE